MLVISESAAQHLGDICGDEAGAAIRIAVMGGGGTGSGLALVADTVRDTDIASEHGSCTVVVDGELMEYCRKITIDFREGDSDGCSTRGGRGFLITAENPLIF